MLNQFTLDYIVRACLADIGETSTRYYKNFLQFGIWAYRRLNLAGLMPTNASVMLDLDEHTRSAELPSDYVDWLKVGLCVNGHVINFDYNEDLCTGLQLNGGSCQTCGDCSNQINSDLNAITGSNGAGLAYQWWYYPYYYEGIFYGGLYGFSGARYRGGFKIIGTRIYFDSWVSAHRILLEYKSNGMAGSATIVPEGALDVIRQHIHLQATTFQGSKSKLDINVIKRDYAAAVIAFRAREAALSLHDWKKIYYESLSQTVKR